MIEIVPYKALIMLETKSARSGFREISLSARLRSG